jgi:hypothetical protein
LAYIRICYSSVSFVKIGDEVIMSEDSWGRRPWWINLSCLMVGFGQNETVSMEDECDALSHIISPMKELRLESASEFMI